GTYRSGGLDGDLVGPVADPDLVGHGAGDGCLAVGRFGGRGRRGGRGRLGGVLADVSRALRPGRGEFRRSLGEQGTGEAFLVRAVAAFEREGVAAQLLPFGFEQVGGPAGDRLLLGVLGRGLDDFRVALAEGGTVVTEHQVGELAGEDLVA